MGLLGSLIDGLGPKDPKMPFLFKMFPFLAIAQIGVGALGVFSGINLLKLKVWTRGVLEVLTWLLLISAIGLMIYFILNLVPMISGHGPRGLMIIGIIVCSVFTGIPGVALGIMLKYLRGSVVKNAIKNYAKQSLSADARTSRG